MQYSLLTLFFYLSVLDDNKLLTLPSGERLSIPDNLKILLEVDSLEQATPATVSRCGMIWFSEDTVSVQMCLNHMLLCLRSEDLVGNTLGGNELPSAQNGFLDAIQSLVISDNDRSTSLVEGRANKFCFPLKSAYFIVKNLYVAFTLFLL